MMMNHHTISVAVTNTATMHLEEGTWNIEDGEITAATGVDDVKPHQSDDEYGGSMTYCVVDVVVFIMRSNRCDDGWGFRRRRVGGMRNRRLGTMMLFVISES